MHTLVVMRSFHAHLSNLTFRQVNVCYSKSTGTVLLRKQPPLLWQGFFYEKFCSLAAATFSASTYTGCSDRKSKWLFRMLLQERGKWWNVIQEGQFEWYSHESDELLTYITCTYITTKDVQLFSNCQSKCWQCTNVETLRFFVATLCFFRCSFLF